MSHPIDRPLRAALAIGLAVAVLGLPSGIAGASEAPGSGDAFRLAQAGPGAPRGGAPQKAAPQAQAPGQPPGDQGEQQITELKKRLAITPQQQPQFDAFAQVMRQNAQAMEQMMQQDQQSPNRNAVEDLKAAVKTAKAEADGLERLLPPLQALYDSLSDPQKKTADQVLASGAGADQAPPPPPAKAKKR
jgi:periplasmic protein CpxP/Spy